MLRRKLLLTLGSLVAMLLVAAIGAILMLQSVLMELAKINEEAAASNQASAAMAASLSLIDAEINRLMLGNSDRDLVALKQEGQGIDEQARSLDKVIHASAPELRESQRRIETAVPMLTEAIETLDGSPDQAGLTAILQDTSGIREFLATFDALSRQQTELAHEQLVTRFRTMIVGMGLLFLVLINVSIVVLIHAATMILKPVNALMESSRRLAREDFDHRVDLHRHDEFGELALSYNHLAEQLQHNEQRKIETLQQVARTMNHELNNALSVIELQLRRIEKSQQECRGLEKPLRQIHETLRRIGKTVDALKRVRRIVLTDYVSGVKMLDLERSVEEEPTPPSIATRPMTEIRA